MGWFSKVKKGISKIGRKIKGSVGKVMKTAIGIGSSFIPGGAIVGNFLTGAFFDNDGKVRPEQQRQQNLQTAVTEYPALGQGKNLQMASFWAQKQAAYFQEQGRQNVFANPFDAPPSNLSRYANYSGYQQPVQPPSPVQSIGLQFAQKARLYKSRENVSFDQMSRRDYWTRASRRRVYSAYM